MNLLGAAATTARQQHPSSNITAATSQQQRTLHSTAGISRVWAGCGASASIWEIVHSEALHLFLGDADADAEMGTLSSLYGNFFALAFLLCCCCRCTFRSLESGRLMRKAMILGACYNEDLQRTIVRLTPAAPLPPTFGHWEWDSQPDGSGRDWAFRSTPAESA